jgi:hypothetical protein
LYTVSPVATCKLTELVHSQQPLHTRHPGSYLKYSASSSSPTMRNLSSLTHLRPSHRMYVSPFPSPPQIEIHIHVIDSFRSHFIKTASALPVSPTTRPSPIFHALQPQQCQLPRQSSARAMASIAHRPAIAFQCTTLAGWRTQPRTKTEASSESSLSSALPVGALPDDACQI